MDEINEGSTATLTIGFTNKEGEAVTPDSLSYSVIDFFSGTEVDSDNVNSLDGTSYDLILSDKANGIVNQFYAYEIRTVTLIYVYDADQVKTETYEYKLINMAGVPIPGDE